MPKKILVKEDDLIMLLDCFEACTSDARLEDWCVDVGNERGDLDAAEDRLRKAVGKSPVHK